MKKKELNDFKKKTLRDLEKTLNQEKKDLEDLKFDLSLGKVDNVSQIRATKKNIAQLMTLINSKTIADAKDSSELKKEQ
ncbi:MAG: 50S ribosomal protein L29 [Candidatus Paceibacterota bacterium]